MTKRRNALIAAAALWWAGSAFAIEAKDLKRALDGGGNWLIEQFDLKEKVFGKGERAKDVTTVAMCVKALCDNPRDYKETSGPFISEPVKYLLSQIGEDGKLKGANAAKPDAYALVAEALKATRNDAHSAVLEKCLAAGRAASGCGKDEIAQLKWEIACLRAQIAALPPEVQAVLPKGPIDVVVDSGPSGAAKLRAQQKEKAEARAVEVLKLQRKDGAFSEDVKAHAACLVALNRCYSELK